MTKTQRRYTSFTNRELRLVEKPQVNREYCTVPTSLARREFCLPGLLRFRSALQNGAEMRTPEEGLFGGADL